MKHNSKAITLALALVLIALAAPAHSRSTRSFAVAEEIGLAHFLDPSSSVAIAVSPNGRLVALQPAERGLLKENVVEDELRVYNITALRNFALHRQESQMPAPVLHLRESTYKEGPIIRQIQWLPDSSGLAFLLRTARGNYQLVSMENSQTRLQVLSVMGQDVTTFTVRDPTHYAYTVFSPGSDARRLSKHVWTSVVGTGQSLLDLLFPSEYIAQLEGEAHDNGLRSILWAAAGGPPHAVTARKSGQPIVINPFGRWLALSPDGRTLVTAITVPEVPERWVHRFRPPYQTYPFRMHAGHQNLSLTMSAGVLVSEYVFIDVQTGAIRPVNGAPTGIGNGWLWEVGAPEWSDDGKAVLLPNAYPQPTVGSVVAEPCAAIFYPESGTMQCLKYLKPPHTKNGGPEHGFVFIGPLEFVNHRSDTVVMNFLQEVEQVAAPKAEFYVRTPDGRWRVASARDSSESGANSLKVYIRQGLNSPPVVVARDLGTGSSRVIWNPNPELKNISLGEASVYRWKDVTGRAWVGGLYKPENYVAGRRYPLVIQTHGFPSKEFHPSGIYPTAFAARALAASGMIVLQIPMMCLFDGTSEGACNVAGIVGAIRQLSSQGLIDESRVGIIGFSRTVYYVLDALTSSQRRFAAASVTDGVDFGYWQYLASMDEVQNANAHDADSVIGGKPFGTGLQIWLKRSPGFNMQKLDTPLLVVALGRLSLLDMWQPYAALRFLGKPVDLMLLNSDEHVLSNPLVRLASQGGSVDWFRFWLQGYEDPDAAKAQQYRRWEKLCDEEMTQSQGHPPLCVPTRSQPREGRQRKHVSLDAPRAALHS